jgi:hypothetical protein
MRSFALARARYMLLSAQLLEAPHMSLDEILLSQLLDPFRIGLLLALVFTAYNTAGTTGMAIPLILGGVFVAVLIPMSTQRNDVDRTSAILAGLAANAMLVAIIIAARAVWMRLTASNSE